MLVAPKSVFKVKQTQKKQSLEMLPVEHDHPVEQEQKITPDGLQMRWTLTPVSGAKKLGLRSYWTRRQK